MRFRALAPFTPRCTQFPSDVYNCSQALGGTVPPPKTLINSGGLPIIISSFPYTLTVTETMPWCVIGIYKSNLMKQIINLMNQYTGHAYTMSIKGTVTNCTQYQVGTTVTASSNTTSLPRSGTTPNYTTGTGKIFIPVTVPRTDGKPAVSWNFDQDATWVIDNQGYPCGYQLEIDITLS